MNIDCLPQLSDKQLDRLANICSDLGVVFIASVFLPFLFDNVSGFVSLVGVGSALFFWIISLKLTSL